MHLQARGGGGVALGPDPLRRPPPSLLEIGREVPDRRRQRRHKESLLDAHRVKKLFFTPCVYTQNTRTFQQNSIMDEKNWTKCNTIPGQSFLRDSLYPSG